MTLNISLTLYLNLTFYLTLFLFLTLGLTNLGPPKTIGMAHTVWVKGENFWTFKLYYIILKSVVKVFNESIVRCMIDGVDDGRLPDECRNYIHHLNKKLVKKKIYAS